MTKKHFIALAAALASQRASITAAPSGNDTFQALVWRMARLCADANRQFDKQRFIDACYA